jgi:hypothetical protein
LALFTEQTCALEAGVKLIRIFLELAIKFLHPQGADGQPEVLGDLAQLRPRNAESDLRTLEQNLP